MTSGHPIDLLMMASQILEISTPRPLDAVVGGGDPDSSRDDFLASLLDFDSKETTALLHAFLALLSDVATAAEIHSELERRRWRLPDWIPEMGSIEIGESIEMAHILGDGENVAVEARWPSGRVVTILVYIDHNMGTAVKDAFPAVESLASIRSAYLENADADSTVTVIDPADARARIEQAIEMGERTYPPFVSQTWPGCRSLVEFVTRRLPVGGVGFERPSWTEAERRGLARDFFDSPSGSPLADDEDARDIIDMLIWFACDYGPGDPLRWSPVSIEILFVDWFPRKILGDAAYMQGMPEAAQALVRYAHDERGIPEHLTIETLHAMDHWEAEYRRAVADRSGPFGLSRAPSGGLGIDPLLDGPIEEYMLSVFAEQAGGRDVLDSLSDAPLPDEAFDWSGIPEDIHERVGEVLGLVDRCSDELLDVEYRTIARRLLARVAAGDPQIFRRKARSDYAAAALLWWIGKANDLFWKIYVKDLMAWFGIKQGSVSQRAETMRRAVGFDPYRTRVEVLGDPKLLHSTKRRSMIEARDRYVERLKADED
ncbi:MAG: DUF6398 domain-containing protein [Actinomycetota bacterium]